MKSLKDIFGKEIFPGDIVGYASSTGIFITVVEKITYNKLGSPLRIKMVYPKIKHHYSSEKGHRKITSEAIIETKYMQAYQQEFIKINQDDFMHYCGKESFTSVGDAVQKVLLLSENIKNEQ